MYEDVFGNDVANDADFGIVGVANFDVVVADFGVDTADFGVVANFDVVNVVVIDFGVLRFVDAVFFTERFL